MTVNGIAYPADAVTGSPTYTALQGRNSLAAFMAGATATRPLGGFSGVRPGTPSTTVTASSTIWGVGAFSGYIDLEASTTNSGYAFTVPLTASGGTVTAAVGSARVDLIYVQIADSNTGDGSSGSPRVIVDYQAGVGGAGIPTLSAARAFVIAQINVPASGGGSPTVTWVAPYTVGAGGILPVSSPAAYPTAATYPGQYIDDLSTGTLKRSNGTGWVPPAGGGLIGVIPTSVAVGSGSFTLSSSGAITFTTASSITINGCFTSTYDNYLVEFDTSAASAAHGSSIVLRAAGSNDTGANYTYQQLYSSGTTTTSSTGALQTSFSSMPVVGSEYVARFNFFAPALARPTRLSIDGDIWVNSSGGIKYSGAHRHNLSTAYDGFMYTAVTANITGTIRIYGYNNL